MTAEFVLVNLELQLHCQKKHAEGMCLYGDSTESRQNYKFQKLTAKKYQEICSQKTYFSSQLDRHSNTFQFLGQFLITVFMSFSKRYEIVMSFITFQTF